MSVDLKKGVKMEEAQCTASFNALQDALYVIGGKWKLKIIISLREDGNMRFNELQRKVKGISARMLSSELKDLEMNGFVRRNVFAEMPVIVEYELMPYSETLDQVLQSLVEWGISHRNKIKRDIKKSRTAAG